MTVDIVARGMASSSNNNKDMVQRQIYSTMKLADMFEPSSFVEGMYSDEDNDISKYDLSSLYSMYDSLVSRGVLNKNIVKVVDDKEIIEYNLIHSKFNNQTEETFQPLPKIMLISGLKGNDYGAVWTLYNLIKIIESGDNFDLAKIKEMVDISFVPVVDIKGFETNSATNADIQSIIDVITAEAPTCVINIQNSDSEPCMYINNKEQLFMAKAIFSQLTYQWSKWYNTFNSTEIFGNCKAAEDASLSNYASENGIYSFDLGIPKIISNISIEQYDYRTMICNVSTLVMTIITLLKYKCGM